MTALETAAEIAKKYDAPLDPDFLGYVIWNYTGYPEFWSGPGSPEECFRKQLEEYFSGQAEKDND